MKSFREELRFETRARRVYINITPQVEECLRESGIREGLMLCNAMHITASVFINEFVHFAVPASLYLGKFLAIFDKLLI